MEEESRSSLPPIEEPWNQLALKQARQILRKYLDNLLYLPSDEELLVSSDNKKVFKKSCMSLDPLAMFEPLNLLITPKSGGSYLATREFETLNKQIDSKLYKEYRIAPHLMEI